MVVFREEKPGQDDAKAWDFWYSRQHSIKMRILDYGMKLFMHNIIMGEYSNNYNMSLRLKVSFSEGVVAQYIEETAHNAVAIRWNPLDKPAKINIAINCLSTDFSNQKGVKGLPLHLQIDTFEDTSSATPIHRGYCQVKVFCDKGAERKTRDEERRKDKSKPDGMSLTAACEEGLIAPSISAGRRTRTDDVFHPPTEVSDFYGMAELSKQPLLFTPTADPGELTSTRPRSSSLGESGIGERSKFFIIPLRFFLTQYLSSSAVRERGARNCVHCPAAASTDDPGPFGSNQREISNIRIQVFQAFEERVSRKILVKMDENILKHYSNESAFIISMQKTEAGVNNMDSYDITLSEIDIK
ncbi:hypothetical protein CAPTEDRAFT_198092 [Capitella teleta]|uniref:Grh/CP2 DB domain-containing protein n=1 Tax=Capitella teleta TaxID=283909 RepID=X1ZYA2_CAPTE|nr:hypothetical protein CAPTEDRAFT_198092 [Capitella teleta]|eukprot:ELU04642.1 hypothetical protein CAPTEDRAFT_198092 [Capitella teleta]